MKKRWEIFEPSPDDLKLISQSLSISPITSAILISRGLNDTDKAREFLFGQPKPKDPFSMSGVKEAAREIIASVRRDERVLIFGDYDVDGITSTALLYELLRRIGSNSVECRIPLRGDGYGLNADAVKEIIRSGCDLLLTVDNGVRSVEEIRMLKDAGIRVIVIDHHEAGCNLPETTVIDPKLDEDDDLKNLAGVGVVFKVAQAVLSITEGTDVRQIDPWLKERLDLVALGTIADLVELKGENRLLVKEGLKVIQRGRPGIKMLVKEASLGKGPITAENVSYQLAPRLNASGRVSNAMKALELLLTDDDSHAELLAKELNSLNSIRQKLEKQILEEACLMFEESYLDYQAIVLSSPDWHEGVVGIVASRMAERYCRPAVLLRECDGLARGSARSYRSFDLYAALEFNASLIEKFGGHRYAAGLTVKKDKIESFRRALSSCADEMIPLEERVPVVNVDRIADIKEIDLTLLTEMELLEPFGYGNPPPVLALKGVKPDRHTLVGNGKHFAFDLFAGEVIRGIAFGPPDIDKLVEHDGLFDIAFRPRRDNWNGFDRIELRVVDIINVEPLSSGLVEDAFTEAIRTFDTVANSSVSGGVKSDQVAPPAWKLGGVVDRRNEKSKREFVSKLVGTGPVFLFIHGKKNCVDVAQWLRVRRPEFGDSIVPIFPAMAGKIGTQIKKAFRSGGVSLITSNESPGLEAERCGVALFSLPLTMAQFISVCSQGFGTTELILLFNNGDLTANINLAQAVYPSADEIGIVLEAVGKGCSRDGLEKTVGFSGKYTSRRLTSALAILSEGGLIRVEGNRIVLVEGMRSDFSGASSFRHGLSFKEEVESFGNWALTAGADEIERVIATGQYGNKVFRREDKAIQPQWRL